MVEIDALSTQHSVLSTRMPIVWIIDADQWPRALLRAELIERGYDAVGFLSVEDALNASPERFPDLIVVEMHGLALMQADASKLFTLEAPIVLLTGAAEATEPWIAQLPWAAVLRRPVSIGEIAVAVERIRPVDG